MSNMVKAKRRHPRHRNNQSELGIHDENTTERDVESQSSNNKVYLPDRLLQKRRAAATPSLPLRIRIGPAREFLRKIVTAVITDIDDETLQREDTETILVVITLIKEAIYGILIAFAVLSFALFLDHHFLLKFHTAHNFRRATMSLVNDRETMINMEESSGLKFMDMGQYNFMVFEIDSVTKKKAFATSLLEESSADIERMDADLNQYRQELPKLLALLDLDKFCPPCHWSKGLTCAGRVKHLQNQYEVPRHMAKLSAMAQSSCRKSDKDLENEENAKKSMEVKVMENWDKNKKDYCGECEWDDKMTCDEKVEFLKSQYEIPDDTAKATVFVSKECTLSFQKKSY